MLPCKFCGSPAVEQVRGRLTEDDKGYVAPMFQALPVDTTDPNIRTSMLGNSNIQDNATDTRIVCSNTRLAMRGPRGPITIDADARAWNHSYTGEGFVFPLCDNQTGWNKQEFADYTRFRWDRDHGRES